MTERQRILLMAATAALLALPVLALAQPAPAGVAPEHGGPQQGHQGGHDAGPAMQRPADASPQSRSQGADGSVAGLTHPGATGASPQGMLGNTTAGQGDQLPPNSGPPMPLPQVSRPN